MIHRAPYYANTADGTHCVQAVFRMVLKYFLPKRNFTWKELDALTKKQRGKGTWLLPGLARILRFGIRCVSIEAFDYRKLHAKGEEYVREMFRPTVAEWYLRNSNVLSMQKDIPRYLHVVQTENRQPTTLDIRRLLQSGYLVASDINAAILHHYHGYDSHLVLIIGFDRRNFIIHDPDSHPRPMQRVAFSLFRKAWSKAYGSGPNLVAFRKGR